MLQTMRIPSQELQPRSSHHMDAKVSSISTKQWQSNRMTCGLTLVPGRRVLLTACMSSRLPRSLKYLWCRRNVGRP